MGNDYAIIKVKEDLSSYGQVFLGLGTDETINDTPIHALGYSYENGRPTMKISHGYINNTGNDLSNVLYRCSSTIYGGTSGGPLYSQCRFGVLGSEDPAKKVQTYKTVVGIVTGNYDDNKTVATRIIPEILQFAYDNKYL
ncbi:MAG: serine protease [Oscillospiraceae bacterium]